MHVNGIVFHYTEYILGHKSVYKSSIFSRRFTDNVAYYKGERFYINLPHKTM